jgi:TRAP-type transport system periplasmic protein
MTRLAPAGVMLCAAAACAGSREDVLQLSLAHATPPQSLIALSAGEFARRVNQELAGRVRVVVYGAGQLGGDEVVLQKLRLGTIDLAVPSTVMSATVDALALFEMPYLVRDREHMHAIVDALFWEQLAPAAEQQGYHVLAVWENGLRHVTNNVRPIVTPRDLQGIKLRIPRSTWRSAAFAAFGARPSPMAFSDVFVALQTGVMDGQENPLSNIVNAGLQEVQQYLSLTGHVYSPAYLTAGAARWEQLPAEVRGVLERVARDTQEFVWQTATRLDTELLDRLVVAGMQVNEVDRAAFVRASQPVYDRYAAMVAGGGDLIRRALELADVTTR